VKVIIAGSRDIIDFQVVLPVIEQFEREIDVISEVVSGGARGVDALGEQWAAMRLTPVKRFPADWATWGAAAGPMRNRQMAEYAKGFVLVHTGGKGSASMKYQAQKLGLKILEVKL
jgi:hypothetical protein